MGSTDLDRTTLSMALSQINNSDALTIYTDCQSITPLYMRTIRTKSSYIYVKYVERRTHQSNRLGAEKVFDVVAEKARHQMRAIVKK